MAAPECAVAAHPADRMEVFVLRMLLFAESGIVIPAPGAALAIASACAL